MLRGVELQTVALALLFLGCSERGTARSPVTRPARATLAPKRRTTASAQPAASPSGQREVAHSPAPASTSEPSLAGQRIALEVPGFSPSLVRFPERAGQAPVLLVTHGAGGTAEGHCDLWQRIVENRAILLCVRGRARTGNPADGEYYPDHPTLERETFAALAALRERFAAQIAPGPVFYAGFSQGATMGALMLPAHAGEITRLALVEGGFADWNQAQVREFHERGGQRVLFVCGRKQCAAPAQDAARRFRQVGVQARVEYVRGAGHSHGARVEARIAQVFPWFIEGDARFQLEAVEPNAR